MATFFFQYRHIMWHLFPTSLVVHEMTENTTKFVFATPLSLEQGRAWCIYSFNIKNL